MLLSLQACRGEALDDGVEVDSAVEPGDEPSYLQHLSVPVDTAVMYATAPGRYISTFHSTTTPVSITMSVVVLSSEVLWPFI